MRVGIVSVQRQPQDPYNWLALHVGKGISAFYIRFEDTPHGPAQFADILRDLGVADRVTLRAEHAPAVDRAREDNYRDLQARQADWVNAAIRMAAADGVAWLFHIDDDELLTTPSASWAEVLRAVPASCDGVHLTNWEAFAPTAPTASAFVDPGVRVLGSECAHLYSAYGNGKAATRVTASAAARGPHHFTGRECELPAAEGVVVHYEALPAHANDGNPPARWVAKHMLRAKDDTTTIPFPSTREAIAAAAAGDTGALAAVYRKYRTTDGERFRACPTPRDVTSLW
jgi:hypothetical protein